MDRCIGLINIVGLGGISERRRHNGEEGRRIGGRREGKRKVKRRGKGKPT